MTTFRKLALAAMVLALAQPSLAAPGRGAKAVASKAKPSDKAKPAAPKATAAAPYTGRAEVQAFAADVAARRELPLAWIERQLAEARRIDAARRLVMPAAVPSAKNWAAYRARFVEPERVAAGVAFWRANAAWLQRAEERYGVPADVVVGIVGVETFYGRIVGSFRSIDVLATLAFDFPPGRSDRSAFFRGELEELLVLCAREGIAPAGVRTSFAGAIGLPQFMPGSVNRWAVDFDGDGHVDLRGSAADTVGSVAHYLQGHGWQRGMATHFAVQPPIDAAARELLLAPDILPSFSPAQMAAAGALLPADGQAHAGPLALVLLHNGGGDAAPSYVAGTQNFYAVTRYNWSSYYALAVIELGQAVKAAL